MTRDYLRRKTGLVIRRGPDFLIGKRLGSRNELAWSSSPWDAWITRDWEYAREIARETGGDIWLFNPIVGQIREVMNP